MPFIDVSVKERKGGSVAKFKVEAEVTDLFKKVVAKAITKYLRKTSSDEQVALTQKMESVADRYSCGDLLFDDSHHLSKKLVQKQALTCESQIEKSYYNSTSRGLKLKDLCIHCGEMGGEGFLLDTDQLKERCLSKGYNCYPICVSCLDDGKKVEHNGPQNKLEARKEKERMAKKKESTK